MAIEKTVIKDIEIKNNIINIHIYIYKRIILYNIYYTWCKSPIRWRINLINSPLVQVLACGERRELIDEESAHPILLGAHTS